MIEFRREPFSHLWPEIAALIPGQWNEVGLTMLAGRPDIRPEVDLDLFRSLDRNGRLRCLAARDGADLAGYFVGVLRTLPHYRSMLVGSADTFYLRPDCRGPRTAVRFFGAAEAMLLEARPRALLLHSKIALDQGRLFESLGYQPHDRSFIKFVGDA